MSKAETREIPEMKEEWMKRFKELKLDAKTKIVKMFKNGELGSLQGGQK